MATIRQIEANRRNAQKSTGPRTAEGKAITRFNALKHGVDAEQPSLPGESIDKREYLALEYYAEYKPCTLIEHSLVRMLIDSEWKMRRYRAAEAQVWEQNMEQVYKPVERVILAQTYRRSTQILYSLQRRIDFAQNNYFCALSELKRLRAGQPARNQPEMTSAA